MGKILSSITETNLATCFDKDSLYGQKLKKHNELEDKLVSFVDDDVIKKIYSEIDRVQDDIDSISLDKAFQDGIRFGVMFMTEIYSESN